ncbi:MAG: hypothetical protein Q8Q01_03665 [archaeon]|nr:hypothetical protein [archaeon]
MRKNIPIVIGVLLILLSFLASAQIDTGFQCLDDFTCEEFLSGEYPPGTYYCDDVLGSCVVEIEESADNVSVPIVASTNLPETPIEQSVFLLQMDLEDLQLRIDALERQISEFQGLGNQQEEQLREISQRMNTILQEVGSQEDAVATGLAGLQEDLGVTKTDLSTLEEQVSSRRRMANVLIFLAIIGVVGGVVVYYLRRKGFQLGNTVDKSVVDYITKHVREGKKFPHIQENLKKAGWSDSDIANAYKATMKHNYTRYQQKSADQISPDKKKMAIIGIVGVLLVLGIFFILQASVGQAVYFQRLVGGNATGTAGEITYTVECTAPQIPNPDGDACCTDANNNALCDNFERNVGAMIGGECNDNLQCPQGALCIDGTCGKLADLYKGSQICDKTCNYYSLSVLTSDGESYTIKPKRGSYTAAGALEWKVLQMPDHCNGENVIVPIRLTRKDKGKIVNEEVITLHEGQDSSLLTHPTLPSVSFQLTVDRVFELCEEVQSGR